MRRRNFIATVGLISTVGLGGCMEDGPANNDEDLSPPNPENESSQSNDTSSSDGESSQNDDTSSDGESSQSDDTSSEEYDADSQNDDTSSDGESSQSDDTSSDDGQQSEEEQTSDDGSQSDENETAQNESEPAQNESDTNETESNETGDPNESDTNETDDTFNGISVEIRSSTYTKNPETGAIEVTTNVMNRGQAVDTYLDVEVLDTEGGREREETETVTLSEGESYQFTHTVQHQRFTQPVIRRVSVGLYAGGMLEDSVTSTHASDMPRLVFGAVGRIFS